MCEAFCMGESLLAVLGSVLMYWQSTACSLYHFPIGRSCELTKSAYARPGPGPGTHLHSFGLMSLNLHSVDAHSEDAVVLL